jgi:hypothetical protein
VKFSHRLFTSLNNTIVDSALASKDEVSLNFLINYLSIFFDYDHARKLSNEQSANMIKLLEEKVAGQNKDKMLYNTQTEPLAKILIRYPKSEVIRDYLVEMVKFHAKRHSFDQLNTCTYALRNSMEKGKNLELELDVFL